MLNYISALCVEIAEQKELWVSANSVFLLEGVISREILFASKHFLTYSHLVCVLRVDGVQLKLKTSAVTSGQKEKEEPLAKRISCYFNFISLPYTCKLQRDQKNVRQVKLIALQWQIVQFTKECDVIFAHGT